MENRWSPAEADAALESWGPDGDLARQVYATRLLGADKTLVLHGGGNTSVKTIVRDLFGEAVEVLRVKGSGWDLARIEPAGMPALRLAPLRRLAELESLSDADLVSAGRAALLDAAAPSPSVEMLLHAFLPARFIDHTHANAVLALTNQENWESACREAFGDRLAIVPYAMSGFALAKAAKAAIDAKPDAEGLVLLRHGIFTFGATAEEAYGRMVEFVSRAEATIAKAGRKVFAPAALPAAIASLAEVAPIVRGATALPVDEEDGFHQPFILDFRGGPEVRAFVDGAELARYAGEGPGTPDFVIRTKRLPLILPAPEAGKLGEFKAATVAAVERYVADYGAYFARNNARHGGAKTELDPMPRIVMVPGLGLFGLGRTKREAAMAADFALANVDIVSAAEGLGRSLSVSEEDAFDIEYWSLEQAKLGKDAGKPLQGHVAVVTGGASGIGAATAKAFADQGCAVAVLDLNPEAAAATAAGIGGLGVGCDVTDAGAVKAAFDAAVAAFGGVDILVSNAGAAWQGRIGEVDEAVLRKSFELNFWSHQTVSRHAVAIMTAQGTGGCLLYNTSKQALNPGKNFGPYGLPKAATLFLMKQYALDHGRDGIRANAVNADRIRSGLLTAEMIASRSKARGVSEKDYMAGNLLALEVSAEDVAQAFVHLALARKTTAATVTVDGGNIEASLR
jgi:rhamnose utilization protein RhaD (predicted bifunctional aldolase and dehydrogenase)/NAD(P)-dependent dehydrogenase (short-subunit alcohol dehydrogenase family)